MRLGSKGLFTPAPWLLLKVAVATGGPHHPWSPSRTSNLVVLGVVFTIGCIVCVACIRSRKQQQHQDQLEYLKAAVRAEQMDFDPYDLPKDDADSDSFDATGRCIFNDANQFASWLSLYDGADMHVHQMENETNNLALTIGEPTTLNFFNNNTTPREELNPDIHDGRPHPSKNTDREPLPTDELTHTLSLDSDINTENECCLPTLWEGERHSEPSPRPTTRSAASPRRLRSTPRPQAKHTNNNSPRRRLQKPHNSNGYLSAPTSGSHSSPSRMMSLDQTLRFTRLLRRRLYSGSSMSPDRINISPSTSSLYLPWKSAEKAQRKHSEPTWRPFWQVKTRV